MSEANRRSRRFLDTLIIILLFAGIFVTPMHLRAPILFKRIGYLGYINFPAVLAVLLSFIRSRRWRLTEVLFFALWVLSAIPMGISNIPTETGRQWAALCNNLLPLFLVLYRMDGPSKQKTGKLFLILFDVFIVLFAVLAVEERFNHNYLLNATREWLTANYYKPTELNQYLTYGLANRFQSVWGHPLTGALLFNAFYALNSLYLRQNKCRLPNLVFFPVALIGVLLTASKTGIVVLALLFIILNWEHKKWFLAGIPVLAVLYFTGAFNTVIERFNTGSLTTGRFEALGKYFPSGLYPLRFWTGYSTNILLTKAHPIYPFRAGFEFPPMMLSFDYGILFMTVTYVGVYAYSSLRLLRERKILPWLCYSLIFAEVTTYNGYALRNQDICFTVNLFTLLILNLCTDSGSSDAAVSAGKLRMDPKAKRVLLSFLSLVLCAALALSGWLALSAQEKEQVSSYGNEESKWTPDIVYWLDQTFVPVKDAEVTTLTLYPRVGESDEDPVLLLELYEAKNYTRLYSAEIPFSSFRNEDALTVRFDQPISLKAGRSYCLSVTPGGEDYAFSSVSFALRCAASETAECNIDDSISGMQIAMDLTVSGKDRTSAKTWTLVGAGALLTGLLLAVNLKRNKKKEDLIA